MGHQKNACKHEVQPFCETTIHSPTMHLNSQHAERDLLRYLGLPVDFSIIPYES